jgi:hypothetical protein
MTHPTLGASMACSRSWKRVRCARRLHGAMIVGSTLFLASARASAEETASADSTPPPVSSVPDTVVQTPVTATTEIAAPELAAGAAIAKPVNSSKVVPRNVELPPATEDQEQYWYGWETLTVDAVSAALLVASASTGLEELGAVGGVGYFFGGPIVHWSHGHVAKGFGSLALRVAATVVLGLGAAVCVSSRSEDNTVPCGVAVLGVIAVPAAVTVDAAVFAYDDPPSTDRLAWTTLVPWVNRERSATGLTWVGRF